MTEGCDLHRTHPEMIVPSAKGNLIITSLMVHGQNELCVKKSSIYCNPDVFWYNSSLEINATGLLPTA